MRDRTERGRFKQRELRDAAAIMAGPGFVQVPVFYWEAIIKLRRAVKEMDETEGWRERLKKAAAECDEAGKRWALDEGVFS